MKKNRDWVMLAEVFFGMFFILTVVACGNSNSSSTQNEKQAEEDPMKLRSKNHKAAVAVLSWLSEYRNGNCERGSRFFYNFRKKQVREEQRIKDNYPPSKWEEELRRAEESLNEEFKEGCENWNKELRGSSITVEEEVVEKYESTEQGEQEKIFLVYVKIIFSPSEEEIKGMIMRVSLRYDREKKDLLVYGTNLYKYIRE